MSKLNKFETSNTQLNIELDALNEFELKIF